MLKEGKITNSLYPLVDSLLKKATKSVAEIFSPKTTFCVYRLLRYLKPLEKVFFLEFTYIASVDVKVSTNKVQNAKVRYAKVRND